MQLTKSSECNFRAVLSLACLVLGASLESISLGQEVIPSKDSPFDSIADRTRLAQGLSGSLTRSKLPNERVQPFVSEASLVQYQQLVEELLHSEGFTKSLTNFWLTELHDLNEPPSDEAIEREWLQQQIADDMLFANLPTHAEESRVLALRSAIESIQKAYQEEIKKVMLSDSVEAWYGTLRGMPIPDESTICLELDHRHPLVLKWKDNGGAINLEGSRASLLLNGTHPLSIPISKQEPSTSRFTVCVWLKLAESSNAAIVSNFQTKLQNSWQGYSIGLDDWRPVFHLTSAIPVNSMRIKAKTQVPIHRWFHLAVVYPGTKNAKDIQVYLNGERLACEVLRDRVLLEDSTDHPPSPSLLTLGGGADGQPRIRGEVRQLQVYDIALTTIEVASLATDKPMLPWDELSNSQCQAWREHYIERQDQRCKYHLESLQHYHDSLAKLTKDRFGMFVFVNNLQRQNSSVLKQPQTQAENRSGTAEFVCEKLWDFVFQRVQRKEPVQDEDTSFEEWISLQEVPRDELVKELLASGGKQRAVLRKIVLSDYYLKSVIKSSDSSK